MRISELIHNLIDEINREKETSQSVKSPNPIIQEVNFKTDYAPVKSTINQEESLFCNSFLANSMKWYTDKRTPTEMDSMEVQFWTDIFQHNDSLIERDIVSRICLINGWDMNSKGTTMALNILFKAQYVGYIWFKGNIPDHVYILNPVIKMENNISNN